MNAVPLGNAIAVMLAVWTLLMSGPLISPAVGAEVATLAVFSLATALLITTRDGFRPRLGWRRAAMLLLAIGLGFAGLPLLRIAVALIGLALGFDPSWVAAPGRIGLPMLIAVVIAAPCFEELLYRERLLDAISATALGTVGATIGSSALFALSHLAPWHMLGSFVVGIVLVLARRSCGTLTPCIGLHIGLNLRAVWTSIDGALHA